MSDTLGAGPDNVVDRGEALSTLRAHFQQKDFSGHPGLWDELWQTQEFLPWDRSKPSPALIDAFAERADLLSLPQPGGTHKRALVPGCGRGYDVLLMASLGYHAIGLDVSENATKAAREFAKSTTDYDIKDGSYDFVVGDFFKDDWVPEGGFDLIYDYTFLCALPPEARPAWALRMSQLLAKDRTANLICLEFPTTKPPHTGGPPFGLTADVYVAHLSNPGKPVSYDGQGFPEPSTYSAEAIVNAPKDVALRRVAHWKPERTHAAGQGNDTMSIWQHL